MRHSNQIVVLVSADAEWEVVQSYFSAEEEHRSPYGDWFSHVYANLAEIKKPIIFFHGGWGKVAAAASAQYSISEWSPELLINIGTCGGFEGEIDKLEILIVEKAVIYDIFEQMGDPDVHIEHYITKIDLSWLKDPLPLNVKKSVLVSGDRDIISSDIPWLKSKYHAIAGDWESGAIAWVANRNKTKCLIIRGVTDLVGESGGEAYNGNANLFYKNTKLVMNILLDSIPNWLINYSQRGLMK